MATMTERRAAPTAGRRGRKPVAAGARKESIASFRGSDAFKGWMDELLLHCRVQRSAKDGADLIERALVLYAKEQGFKREAPPR